MENGKISQNIRKGLVWLCGSVVLLGVSTVLLHSCQDRVKLLVKNNRVVITKSK